MQFNPKFGDTIVTAKRGNYICSEILRNGDFYGKMIIPVGKIGIKTVQRLDMATQKLKTHTE